MKNFFLALKIAFKASPLFLLLELILGVLPTAVLSGVLNNANKNMINSAQDFAVGNVPVKIFLIYVIVYLACRVVNAVLNTIFRAWVGRKNQANISMYYAKMVNNKFSKIKYEYFEREDHLDLFEKMSGAEGWVASTYNYSMQFVYSVVSAASNAVVMWLVSPLLSGIAIGVAVCVAAINFFAARVEIEIYSRQGTLRRKLTAFRSIFGPNGSKKRQPELRIFGTNGKTTNLVYNETVDVQKKRAKEKITMNLLYFSSDFLILLMSAVSVVYVLVGLLRGTLNWQIGTIVLALSGFATLASELSNAPYQLTQIVKNSKQLNFLRRFLNLEEQREGTIDEMPTDNTICIDDVCFTYPGTDVQVLNNVSFNLKLGEHIAFVGRNGSGKSTIVKLILGLYEPTKGKILVGGRPICDYTRRVRQKLFGAQYQDFCVYSMKIREVVGVGNLDILNDDNEINKRLEQANVLDAIKEKNVTLDSVVGKSWDNDGLEFSGGQKQRISLATTLAFDHDHLILDEPTAALDAVAENKMYEVFMSGTKNKGSLIVSHRLASARISDRIIVFDQGRVVQDGSHEKLYADKKGLYHKMFEAQAKLYKSKEEV